LSIVNAYPVPRITILLQYKITEQFQTNAPKA
jgi:hypothetical protein